MKKQQDQSAIMMNILQEREREQTLVLSICSALAQATTRDEFDVIVSSSLKEQFHFDDFVFATSDEIETEYQVFYTFSEKEAVKKNYVTDDVFFKPCLDSADNVVFDLKKLISKSDKHPEYISRVQNFGFNNGVGICLPSIKGNKNVLFLFFKNATAFTRESNRILKGIATQLSITVRNIILTEKYERKFVELSILKNNLLEKKARIKVQKRKVFVELLGTVM